MRYLSGHRDLRAVVFDPGEKGEPRQLAFERLEGALFDVTDLVADRMA